jgi:hypothetical protein
VGVPHHEPPRAQGLQDLVELFGAGADAGFVDEAVEDPGAVGVGLEAAEAPEAGVAEGAVVEVHGVLGGDDDADAEGAGLFHEGDEGAFGGRVRRVGREEAVGLVEDDEGAEALGSGEAADPGEDFLEDEAEDEGAFVVVEVGDAEDGDGCFRASG